MRPFRLRRTDAGRSRSRYLAALFGRELRIARVTAGLSQARLASLAGTSQTEVSKAERGLLEISLDARCRLAAACGHELGWRLYPVATVRLRDSGQLALAQMIVAAAHPSWRPRLEAPVAPGDPRAADLILTGSAEILHIEIERALFDLQAQLRAAQLKRELLAPGKLAAGSVGHGRARYLPDPRQVGSLSRSSWPRPLRLLRAGSGRRSATASHLAAMA